MADNFKTYEDIYGDICRAMGDNTQSRLDEVKAVVNMVYLNEICVCDPLYPLHWFLDLIDDVKTKTKATVTGISQANPGVVTAVAHGYVSGDIIQHAEIGGMTELNERIFVAVRLTADTYSLKDLSGTDVNTTSYTAYTSGGYAHHRGVTLSKNFRTITSFNFRGYSKPLTPIGFTEAEENTSWYDTTSLSRPTRYLHKQYSDTSGNEYQRLIWHQLPDNNYYARIWGEKFPDRLSASSDVPVIPARYHDAIVSGSIVRLMKYQEIQLDNAIIWPSIYIKQINSIKTENQEWWDKNNHNSQDRPYLL